MSVPAAADVAVGDVPQSWTRMADVPKLFLLKRTLVFLFLFVRVKFK